VESEKRNRLAFDAAAILASFAEDGLSVEHLANASRAFAALGFDAERAVEGRN